MKCPLDEETLVIAERQGIEIDHCPTCRGVWLDRGELDKLIEREGERGGDRYEAEPRRDREQQSSWRGRDDDDDDDHRHRGTKRKKKGFLSEMFEFGGE